MAIQEANGMRLSHSAQEVDDTIDAVDAIDAKIGGDYSSTSTVASAIADAKKAGTDASSALTTYKTSNDAAVANAKKAGTDASAHADALNTAIDKRVTALEGKEDKDTTYTFTDDTATDSSGMTQTVTVTKVNGHSVEANVPADAKFTDTVYDDTAIKAEIDTKLTGKADKATSLSGYGITDGVTTGGLNAAINGFKKITWSTITIATSAWSNNTATVSVSGVTADNAVDVAPVEPTFDAYINAGIRATSQGSGTLTFACKTVPTVAISVNVKVYN